MLAVAPRFSTPCCASEVSCMKGFFSPRGTALVRNSSQSLVPKLSTGVAAQQGQELPVDGSGGAVW